MRWRSASGTVLLALVALGCGESQRATAGNRSSGGTTSAAGTGGSSAGTGGSGGGGVSGTGGGGVSGAGTGVGGGGEGGGSGTGGGSSGTGGGVDEGGAAGSSEAPTREPGECSLWPALSQAPPSQFSLGGVTVRASEHECAHVLGSPVALPVSGDMATRLLFHYDVNGDGVDDLFVGPRLGDSATSTPVRLLLSKVEGENLSFDLSDCGLPWDIGNGAYFLRDIDIDNVPDLVIGTRNGVRVMMNREGGLVTTIDYEFPESTSGWVGFLDATLGNFDGQAGMDLAMGFDRTPDGISKIEIGTLLFSGVGQAAPAPTPQWLAATESGLVSVPSQQDGHELGYVTALEGGWSSFSPVYGGARLGWLYSNGTLADVQRADIPGWPTSPTFVEHLVVDGVELALVGLEDRIMAFDPHDPTTPARTMLAAFPHTLDHEIGGGTRSRSYYVLDLDGDGKNELVEAERAVDPFADNPVARVVIYAGDVHGWFNEAAVDLLELPAGWDPGGESPFLRVGPMNGRLLVARNVGTASLSVMALGCK